MKKKLAKRLKLKLGKVKSNKNRCLTIGIDARFYGISSRGLGRYTEMLIKNLEKIDRKNKYIVYLRKDNYHEYVIKNKNFEKKIVDVPWYSFKEQILMPFLIDWKKLDIIHFPHFNIPLLHFAPFVVTIHDLILLEYPTKKATMLGPIMYFVKNLGYKLILHSSVRFSRKIISVSGFTKKEILKYFNVEEEKIRVVYEGCEKAEKELEFSYRKGVKKNSRKHPKSIQTIEKQKDKIENIINKEYLLYVGAAYPHKNLERLIKVLSQIRKIVKHKKLRLVFVGEIDYFYKKLINYCRKKRIKGVIFLGKLESDDDLNRVYANAKLFVFPSLYEGFGFPPLEAMREGTVVASSFSGSLSEILGDAAILFNPNSLKDMKKALIKGLTDKKIRKLLQEKAKQRIKRYSFKQMAKKTLEIYESAV